MFLKPTAARFIRLHFAQIQNLNSGSVENLYLINYWEDKLIPISDMKHDCDEDRYYTYNQFFEGYAFEYETFWDNCTTPSGDKVVAFGYYGHD